MLDPILAPNSVSISTLKKNPSAVIKAAEGAPVAVLNHNKPTAYIVPADAWEAMLERLEDAELAEIVRSRQGEVGVPVDLDAL